MADNKDKKKINYAKLEPSDFTDGRYKFQLFGRWLTTKFILPIFYRIEYVGREKIPQDRNFVLAGNHISYFDPFVCGEAINQPLSFMGKKELFENGILAFIMRNLCCFAVNREKLEISTIKTALNVLKTDKWRLGIFPQGGIRRNRKLEKINKGFAVIAKQMKTDILPVGIIGSEEYNWIPFKGKIKVMIGDIISYNQEYDEIIDEWARKVSELTGYEYVKEANETPKEPAKQN